MDIVRLVKIIKKIPDRELKPRPLVIQCISQTTLQRAPQSFQHDTYLTKRVTKHFQTEGHVFLACCFRYMMRKANSGYMMS
jgi:hypothetical protein